MAEVENLVLEQLRLIRQEQAELRREVGDVRTLCLSNVEYSRRVERRVTELRDDLELMLKSELMGRFTHFETRMEQELGAIADRVGALEGR